MNFEQMLDDVYSELGETQKNKIVQNSYNIIISLYEDFIQLFLTLVRKNLRFFRI